MKVISFEKVNLENCIDDAQHERIIITRKGKPVVLLVGIEGMDEEQLQLAFSDKFWTLINQRRKQKTLTRKQLEEKLDNA